MWCGYAIVLIGVVFLLGNLGVLPVGAWDYIWPSLLIIWGIGIIRGRSGFWCVPPFDERESRPADEANTGIRHS